MNVLKKPTKRHADPSNDGGNIDTMPENAALNEPSKLLKWVVNHRKITLILSALGGSVFFGGTYYFLPECLPECPDTSDIFWCKEFSDLTRNSLSLLILGLPTFFILWVFRTYDVQKQIDDNTFFECARMLASEEKRISKRIALELLLNLKQKNPSYKEKIESLIRVISLEEANLNFTQLSDIDLSGVNLTNAYLVYTVLVGINLTHANLTRANLTHANLTYVDLTRANLTEAKLYGTNLEKTEHYDTANFTGAEYDENTKFPPGFDPQKAGCIKDPVASYNPISVE